MNLDQDLSPMSSSGTRERTVSAGADVKQPENQSLKSFLFFIISLISAH